MTPQERLRQFGESKFSSMTEFARAMKVSPQTLNKYLNSPARLGGIMQDRLSELGADVRWITKGIRSEDAATAKSDAEVEKLKSEMEAYREKAMLFDAVKEIVDRYPASMVGASLKKFLLPYRPTTKQTTRRIAAMA